MDVTLLGIVSEVRPVQPLKASPSMVVKLLGNVIDFKPVQPWKAKSPIFVTLLGITVFLHPINKVLEYESIIALQLFRESKELFPLSTDIEAKLAQLAKTPPPID